jgi:anti-anti-sigma factor
MADLELTFSLLDGPREGQLVLQLNGPLTLSNLFDLQDYLRSLEKPSTLVLDMTNVPYMDSAGLGAVLNYYVSAEKAHRNLVLIAVNDRVGTLLELTKVDKLLTIFPTLQAFESLL